MPRQIEISDATFRMLQELAVPLVDNMDSLITRLVKSWKTKMVPEVVAVRICPL